jgi:hypothetical protein
MDKQKIKSLALWLVIGLLGLVSVGGAVYALSGNFPVGIETCSNCVFNVSGSQETGETLGATANRIPHGYWDTADGYYVDGSEVIDGSGIFVGAVNGTTGAFSSTLNATGNVYGLANLSVGTSTMSYDLWVTNGANTSTLAVGSSASTKVSKFCLWNGSEFTVLSYSGSTTTLSAATSTTCI